MTKSLGSRVRSAWRAHRALPANAAVEKLRQSARKMKDKGFAVADIADLTGLTADEIAAL